MTTLVSGCFFMVSLFRCGQTLNGVVIHAFHTTGDRKLSPLRRQLPVVLGDQEGLPPNLTHRAEEEASECAGIGLARVPLLFTRIHSVLMSPAVPAFMVP